MDELPVFKIGEWVVITEDGIWAMDDFSFKTKAKAIEEVSIATLDSRNKPKVKRIMKGEYLYFPKDPDFGTFGEAYTIRKVTQENEGQLNALMKEQWDSDPSYNN